MREFICAITIEAFSNSGLDNINADSEAYISLFVGQRGLNQRNIHAFQSLLKQGRHLREKNRRIIRKTLVDRITYIVADKESIQPEVAFEFFLGKGRNAKRPEVKNLGIYEGLRVFINIAGKSTDKVLGFAAGRADEYVVAAMDMVEYFVQSDIFFRIAFLKFGTLVVR